MNDYNSMDWKVFTIKAVEVLRWPLVLAVLCFILRVPLGKLIMAIAGKLSG